MSLTKVTNSMIQGAVVNVLDFGADPTGTTECSTQINAAMTAANTLNTSVFMPAGSYKISTAITPAKGGVTGAGSTATTIVCNGCSAFVFPNEYVSPRRACVIEKLSVSSFSNSCDSVYAFYAGGVASGAAVVYNSGITVMDVSINNRFGGGFYFKDCFEVNVDRIIMSAVGRPVLLVGSVVQSYFSHISAFGDARPVNLGDTGFETNTASYSSGTLTPEHITTTDCSWINYNIGVEHSAGLLVSFINTDVQTTTYGMRLSQPCIVYGGIMGAMGNDLAGWVGIDLPPFDFEIENSILIESVLIQPLLSPANPSTSFGIRIGNGVAEKYSVAIDKCIFKGSAGIVQNAIYSNKSRGVSITNCRVNSSISIGDEFSLLAAFFASITTNMFSTAGGGGKITVNNGASVNNGGTITGNYLYGGSVTLTTGSPANWLVQNNI
jgi:hypothetical protein